MVMTSGSHNRKIHYFSQHWLASVPLVQLIWPGTPIAEGNGRAGLYTGYKVGKINDFQPLGQHLTFEEKGFFIGGSYGWLIADAGLLSLNLAYAKLDGRRRQKTVTGFKDLEFSIDFEGTGDAEGLSYGASWSSLLTDYVSYSIGLNIEEYTFKNITDPNVSFTDEIEEKLSDIAFST